MEAPRVHRQEAGFAMITKAAAREELNRRATAKEHRGRWVLHVPGLNGEHERAARQADNKTLRAKAGDGYTPVPRDDAWVAKHAPEPTSKPLGSKADTAAKTAAQEAFKAAFEKATRCKQYAGKLAAGYVAHQGMSHADAVSAAVTKAEAYVRKADRVNA